MRLHSWPLTAVSVAVLAGAVLAPPVAAAVEQPVPGDTVVGELVQAYAEPAPGDHEDDPGGHEDALLSWIEPDTGAAVRVPTEDVAAVEVGATVEVTLGGSVVDAAVAEGLEPAVDVLAAEVVAAAPADPLLSRAAPGTTHEVTVALVVPAGATPDGRTPADVAAAVDGPVSAFWAAQTDGAVRFGVTAASGWYSAAAGCEDPYGLWAEAAARTGWVRGPNRHLLVYVPTTASGCSAGLAEVGRSVTSGGRALVNRTVTSLVAHELGHNLGLGHASRLRCDGTVDTGACGVERYADWYDLMGVSWEQMGSLNAAHAARLGVLPAGAAPTVSAGAPPAQFVLAPAGARTGTRAVRLADADGDVYWLEYRTPTGQDAWLGTSANYRRLPSGVGLRLAGDGEETSLLLDGTPSRSAQWAADTSAVLPGGVPVTVGGFTVQVLEANAGGARVEVSGQPAPPPAAPAGPDAGGIGGTGATYYLNDRFTGIADRVFGYGGPLDTVLVGDWNGDGVDTLAVRRGNVFHLRDQNTSGPADRTIAYGDPGDTVLVGDWDGDGRDTLAVRRGNLFLVKNSLQTGVADSSFAYGDPGDVVLVGDWDGDRADSLTVRRGAVYHVRNGLTTGVADAVFGYGDPADTVLVGRWGTDQRGDTVAVRRGNVYHLRASLTTGPADRQVAYGEVTDTAFTGDWNADGVDTLGVRRPG
ncbi:hypothetical protein [Geodermatophilus sp. DSM 44513]|uniref:hypothetical protein n=1 Tax=Geodermatophilus sp. DSM 44513 TaxID=1528104 RepID=UPI001277421F|nr:hypothetical protein [Geodermatophilus sp. DSM 44513]WNV74827.1 hypothetical protein RTG05_17785 [Geodermatophilus sp. DSM 44513]